MSDPHEHDRDEMPTTDELQQPSTEKEPDEEPRKATPDEPEPSHRAVGIGVEYSEPEEDAEPDERGE